MPRQPVELLCCHGVLRVSTKITTDQGPNWNISKVLPVSRQRFGLRQSSGAVRGRVASVGAKASEDWRSPKPAGVSGGCSAEALNPKPEVVFAPVISILGGRSEVKGRRKRA